jgi:hypothetical protein
MSKDSRPASVELVHLGGVPWWEAPIPWRWHKCFPQTVGWLTDTYVERCACGAISGHGARGYWMERNSRRRAA